MIQIHPPGEKDFAAIGEIFYQAVHQLACKDYTAQQLQAWAPGSIDPQHWRGRTANLEVRVATIANEVAGFIGFSRAGYIDLLFTSPAHSRRGVARALLEEAERFLRAIDVTKATAEASLTARPVFEALNYRCIREQTVNCQGVDLRNFWMEKQLP